MRYNNGLDGELDYNVKMYDTSEDNALDAHFEDSVEDFKIEDNFGE